MTSCSFLWAPFRWLRRDPTYGHAVMHPTRSGAHGLILQCSQCLRTWASLTCAPSPIFQHRQFVAAIKGVANVILFRKAA